MTFKIGDFGGCGCEETLKLIAEGKLDTEPLVTHIKIENVTQGKILYDSLTFGARDYSIEFNANAGDEIRMTLEGFYVAEFHGYDFFIHYLLYQSLNPQYIL